MEVLACGLQSLVRLEIPHELLLAVGSNTPLRGHEGGSMSGKDGEIDSFHFIRGRRWMEAR